MILATHIILALISVTLGGFTTVKPTKNKLKLAYILGGSTLGSGVLLVVLDPKTMAQACITGLFYFLIIGVLIAVAQHRLPATQKINN